MNEDSVDVYFELEWQEKEKPEVWHRHFDPIEYKTVLEANSDKLPPPYVERIVRVTREAIE